MILTILAHGTGGHVSPADYDLNNPVELLKFARDVRHMYSDPASTVLGIAGIVLGLPMLGSPGRFFWRQTSANVDRSIVVDDLDPLLET